jgi:hypothetical protein
MHLSHSYKYAQRRLMNDELPHDGGLFYILYKLKHSKLLLLILLIY